MDINKKMLPASRYCSSHTLVHFYGHTYAYDMTARTRTYRTYVYKTSSSPRNRGRSVNRSCALNHLYFGKKNATRWPVVSAAYVWESLKRLLRLALLAIAATDRETSKGHGGRAMTEGTMERSTRGREKASSRRKRGSGRRIRVPPHAPFPVASRIARRKNQ